MNGTRTAKVLRDAARLTDGQPLITLERMKDQGSNKSGWGGARTGSGRKPKFDEPAGWHTVHMPDSLWREISQQAKDHGLSRSEVVVRLLRGVPLDV